MPKNTKPKAAPTPWSFGVGDDGWFIDSEHGQIASLCNGPDFDDGFNAALIVRAVNSNQALVEAIRKTLNAAETDWEYLGDAALAELRAALKLAGEGE
jgi:hypothetical protein